MNSNGFDILYINVKSNLPNAPKCLQVSQIQNVNKNLPGMNVYTLKFLKISIQKCRRL